MKHLLFFLVLFQTLITYGQSSNEDLACECADILLILRSERNHYKPAELTNEEIEERMKIGEACMAFWKKKRLKKGAPVFSRLMKNCDNYQDFKLMRINSLKESKEDLAQMMNTVKDSVALEKLKVLSHNLNEELQLWETVKHPTDNIPECVDVDSLYNGDCKSYNNDGIMYLHNTYVDGVAILKREYYGYKQLKSLVDRSRIDDHIFISENYYNDGIKESEISYKYGGGSYLEYYKENGIRIKGTFEDGSFSEFWYAYDKSGGIIDSVKADLPYKRVNESLLIQDVRRIRDELNSIILNYELEGRMTKIDSQEMQISELYIEPEIVDFPDKLAEFPGGSEAMSKFIKETIKYPKEAINNNDQGKVYVSFNVEHDGKITDVKLESRLSIELDDEAIRIVQSMPNWIPAIDRGKPVRSRCRIPIVFELD